MATETVESKVERLERRVTKLEKLPERIGGLEAQILHFRTEVRDECSAVRQEMASGFSAVRQEMAEGLTAVRAEMRDEFAAVRGDIDETRRYMRVLHEEVLGRFAVLGEGRRSRNKGSDVT